MERKIKEVHYHPTPSLRSFHKDNSQVRGVLGPTGCVDGQTEYLSPEGWRRIDSYTSGLVGQWQDGVVSLVEPQEYIAAPCDGMYHFHTKYGVDQMLSANHRVLFWSKKGARHVLTAAEIAHKHWTQKSGWDGRFAVTFSINNGQRTGLDLDNDKIRVMVAVIADGSFTNLRTGYCRVNLKKQRKKDRLEQLLAKAQIKYVTGKMANGFTVYYFHAPRVEKVFGLPWWSCTQEQLEIVADEVCHWDSHVAANGVVRFSTLQQQSADFIQYAFAASGRRTHLSCYNRTDRGMIEYAVMACNRKQVGILGHHASDGSIRRDNIRYVQLPEGHQMQYCFTVPSGFLVLRRNGCIFVTGNSGKSVAMVSEMMMRGMAQEPDSAGIRRTRWGVFRSCFDDRTEILTEFRGWQLFRDLTADDKVASLIDGSRLEFVKPSMYFDAPYEGDMIGFQNEGIDFLVTPDHKLYLSQCRTRKKVWSDFEFKKAHEVEGSRSYRFKRDATWCGTTEGHHLLSEPPVFFEWLGLLLAEGHIKRAIPSDGIMRRHIGLSQVKADGVAYAHKLFQEANIRYSVDTRKDGNHWFRVLTKTDYTHQTPCRENLIFDAVCDVGISTTLRVPIWVKQATSNRLKAFLRGYQMGDGCFGRRNIIYTSSRYMADDLQEIALKAGMVVNLRVRDRRGVPMCINGVDTTPTAPEWNVALVQPSKYMPALKYAKSPNGKTYRGWYRTHYQGNVYCLEVPSHVVYVRRNGVAHWSSQTYPSLISTTIKTFSEWSPQVARVVSSPTIHWHWKQNKALRDGTGMDMEVLFIAVDDPRTDIDKLRSLDLTGAWVNEAQELQDKLLIEWILNRCGRYPRAIDAPLTWSGMIMDSNAMSTTHWWYELAEEIQPAGWKFWKQPPALLKVPAECEGAVKDGQGQWWVINPECENLVGQPKHAQYWLDQVPGKDTGWIVLNLCAQYGASMLGKVVFPEFDEARHKASEPLKPEPGVPLQIGYDTGLTPTFVITQITPAGQYRILDECGLTNMGMRQALRDALKPMLANKYPGWPVFAVGDPAGKRRADSDESTAMDEIIAQGIQVKECPTNLFKPRRDALASFMLKRVRSTITGKESAEGFIVSPTCKMVLRGLREGYVYGRILLQGRDAYKEEPVKNEYSHYLDACQYPATLYDRPKLTQAGLERRWGKDGGNLEIGLASDYFIV